MTKQNSQTETQGGGSSPSSCSQITDTQRLKFLLQFFRVDDVGDEEFVPGVVVDHEAAEEQITYGPADADGRMLSNINDWKDDMRDVIDRAIIARSPNDKADTRHEESYSTTRGR